MNTSPDFESIKQINILGREYWSARDLMPLLGYGKKWQNFVTVVQKAMSACHEELGLSPDDHFTGVSKMIATAKEAKRVVDDFFLSKRA